MTQLQDQMKAAIANLKGQHGVTEDQVNSIVSGAVAPLKTSIDAILADKKPDEDKLADVIATVTEFTTAFASATPAPAPAPVPAPTPAPDSAPDSAPVTAPDSAAS